MLTKKLQRKALSLCKGCTRNSGGKSHNRPKRGKKCTSPAQICVIQTTQQKQTKKNRKRPEPNTNNQPPREKPSMPANSSNQTNSKALTLHHRAENNNDRKKINPTSLIQFSQSPLGCHSIWDRGHHSSSASNADSSSSSLDERLSSESGSTGEGRLLGVQILYTFPTQKQASNKSNKLMTSSCASCGIIWSHKAGTLSTLSHCK